MIKEHIFKAGDIIEFLSDSPIWEIKKGYKTTVERDPSYERLIYKLPNNYINQIYSNEYNNEDYIIHSFNETPIVETKGCNCDIRQLFNFGHEKGCTK